jgi:hypothetical protein
VTALTFDSSHAADDASSRTITLPPIQDDDSGDDGSRGRHLDPERPPRTGSLGLGLAVLVVLQSVVVLDLDVPVVRPAVAFVTLLALPTLVLYKRAGLPGDSAVARFAYAFGASLLAVIVVGLLINTLLPVVGIDRPLTPLVLGLTWLAIDAALLRWRRTVPLLVPTPMRQVVRRVWDTRADLAHALALVAVAAAVLGAIRLNNGADGVVALAGHLLAAAALVVLMLRQGTLGRDARVLFLVGVALLLATSLRGWGITGHDIQAEYYAFSLTDGAHHWSMDVLQNAYNACLSVTILPSVLAQATGLSGVTVFKVVLQVAFALVPVLTYLVSRRFVPRRLALVGVVFVMAFPTFSTDMPYLVRQEIAFLFLGLVLLAGTEPGRRHRRKQSLVALFGLGVVLSHYSTTYLLLLGLLAGLLLLGAAGLVARLMRRRVGSWRSLVLLSPLTVAFLAVVSTLWAGPVTDTGSHAEDVARSTIAAIFGKGDDRPGSSDLSFSLLGGDDASPRERLNMFVKDTMELREQAPPEVLLIDYPGVTEKRPPIVEADDAPLTPAGEVLDSIGVDPGWIGNGARYASAALLQVFLLVGVWRVLAARRRAPRRHEAADDAVDDAVETEAAPVTSEVAALVLGVMAALGLVVLLPSLSVEYGVLRAFMQTILVVAPVAAVGLWWLLKRFDRSPAWLVGVPAAVFLVLTAAAPSLLGGSPAKLALHNDGLYHDRYVASDSDEVAIDKVAATPGNGGPMPKVITSRNQVLRVATEGVDQDEVVDRIFPTLLTKGSYVFVDAGLAREREATIFYSGDRITYKYPLGTLDRRLDLVYSSGASRVYR